MSLLEEERKGRDCGEVRADLGGKAHIGSEALELNMQEEGTGGGQGQER